MKFSNTQRNENKQSIKKLKKNFFLDNATFRISKISLNNIIEPKKNQLKFKVDLNQENNFLSRHEQKNNSQYLQRTQSANYKIKQPVSSLQLNTSPLLKNKLILDSPIQINLDKHLFQDIEKEVKQFNIQTAKISKKQYCNVKAYAVNTHSALLNEKNQDRLSIITNLTNCDVKDKNSKLFTYFAIYDGHNGSACAQFLRDYLHLYLAKDPYFNQNISKALQNSLRKVEFQFMKQAQRKSDGSGSSALIVLIQGKTCYIANIGDSRAILSQNFGKQIINLSNDHNPMNQIQLKRIINCGGSIYQNKSSHNKIKYPHKIIPSRLEVSRSIGDYEIKSSKQNKNIIISEPEIKMIEIKQQSDFILMASDGLFDSLTNEEVVKFIWSSGIYRKKDNLHEQCGDIVNGLIMKAVKKSAIDCISCLMICFQNMNKALFDKDQILLPGVNEDLL